MYRFIFCAWVCAASTISAQERIPGDINGDGRVDFADFIILSENFGETGGEPFNPQAWRDTVIVRDTVLVAGPIVYKTIRDTIVLDSIIVRDTVVVAGPVVYETIRDTIWETSRAVSSIVVEDGDWQQPRGRVQYVCEVVRDVLSEPFMFPLDSDIFVRHRPQGPIVFLQRAAAGEHVVGLNTQYGRTEQNIFQFAHEYTHILTGYYRTRFGANEWLDESLASMGSLYTLRLLTKKLEAGELSGLRTLPGNLIHYAQHNIPNWDEQRLTWITADQFLEWFRSKHQQMRNNAYLRDYNDIVAHNLIDIFEENPEAWNVVRYTNGRGPNSWDPNQDFKTYLRGWYERTPARWQKYVVEIARRFGYFPKNVSGPLVFGDGVE